MHPILTDRRLLVLHLAVWAVLGGMLSLMVPALFGTPWVGSIGFGVPVGVIAGLIGLSAWYVSRATPAHWSGWARPLATWLAAAAIGGLLWAWMADLWWQVLERANVLHLADAEVQTLIGLIGAFGVLGYLLAVAFYRVGATLEANAAATQRALQLEVTQRDAELRALRARLDPHFLFNSLNSISGLIAADPVRAREMCQLLADFLRQSLRVSEAARITLEREVALAEQYLRVEQVRFGTRLGLTLTVAPNTADVEVPALLLQPLVENAVQHGIATLVEGGTIAVSTRRAGGHVVITVENPRDPDARRRGTGLGLDIVRRRLAAAYGEGASLTVAPEAAAFRAQVTVPAGEVL